MMGYLGPLIYVFLHVFCMFLLLRLGAQVSQVWGTGGGWGELYVGQKGDVTSKNFCFCFQNPESIVELRRFAGKEEHKGL